MKKRIDIIYIIEERTSMISWRPSLRNSFRISILWERVSGILIKQLINDRQLIYKERKQKRKQEERKRDEGRRVRITIYISVRIDQIYISIYI